MTREEKRGAKLGWWFLVAITTIFWGAVTGMLTLWVGAALMWNSGVFENEQH
jgi:hypothetical protein